MRRQNLVWIVAGFLLTIVSVAVAPAAVKLPSIIGDNMVLQHDQPVPIWGWADKGEEVTVTLRGQIFTTKAAADGRWKVVLEKLKVGQTLEMTVQGSSGNSITLKNVLVGEAWVCSGQSNMAIGISMCDNAEEEIAAADYPAIRLFMAQDTKASQPADDVKGTWKLCTPENVAADGAGGFSAVAYYFGRMLHKEMGVPVGLIDTTYGGTPADFWTSRKALETDPELKLLGQGGSSCLYNGMIAPLTRRGRQRLGPPGQHVRQILAGMLAAAEKSAIRRPSRVDTTPEVNSPRRDFFFFPDSSAALSVKAACFARLPIHSRILTVVSSLCKTSPAAACRINSS